MEVPKSSDATLVSVLRILARDIESGDGVANACIAEAAERLAAYVQAWDLVQRHCELEMKECVGFGGKAAASLDFLSRVIKCNDPRVMQREPVE